MSQPAHSLAKKYTASLENVPCNACGSLECEPICDRERFGLPLRTVICRQCGLMYINPRPTREQYAEFYKSDYRKVVSGSDEGDSTRFDQQISFTRGVILPLLNRFAPGFIPATILDLGCSDGGILYTLLQTYPGSVGFGLEPLVKISEYARRRTGATIYTSLLEDFAPDQCYDLIVFPRSLNHSLDPLGNLIKIRSMLTDQGLFVLTLDDPTTRALRVPLEQVTEMTHPYMFTPETARYLLDRAGLEVLGHTDGLLDARRMSRRDFRQVPLENMRFLSRRGKSGGTGFPGADHREILERLRANQAARLKYGAYMEKWRHPTFWMRAWRKILRTIGLS